MNKYVFNRLRLLSSMAILSILLVSCAEDDEVNLTGPESDLIGLWTISANNVTLEAFIGEQTIVEYLVSEEGYTQEEAELAYASYLNEIESDFEISGTIEFKADKTYVAIFPPDDTDVGTWKLSSDGKTLILDEGDPIDEQILAINSASSSTMSITIVEEGYDDTDNDDEITIAITLLLTK